MQDKSLDGEKIIVENPDLLKPLIPDTEMKEWLISHVGKKENPENGEVNLEMIIKVMAEEFPEFLLPIAEENFIRGYQQEMMDDPDGLAQAMMDITHQTHQHEIDLQTKDEEA